MPHGTVRVLLVDDDEDDFVIVRDLVAKTGAHCYQLDWVDNYEAGLAAIERHEHDVCLLDYRLGVRTGLELLREAQSFSTRLPLILLTGQGDHKIDLEAMKAGAADYLIKGQLTSDNLERAVRYAIENWRAEERLRRERDLISHIMETSPVGIIVTDQSGEITFANHRAVEVLSLTKNAIKNKSCGVLDWCVADLEGYPIQDRPLPLKQLLETGQPVQDVCHVLDFPDDRRVLLSTNARPLLDAAGKIDGMVITIEDITEKKKLETQFLRSQRMESVGTLAGGIAHDLNNVLTPLLISVQLLKKKITGDEGQKLLDTLEANVVRGAKLVKQVLAFGRGIHGERIPIQPAHIIREIEQIVQETFPKSVEFQADSAAGLLALTGDATQLHQVLLNLCVNARDAMPAGGRLSVKMENVVLDKIHGGRDPEAKPGPYVVITVTDTGTGIPKEIRNKIFEPFFTTKAPGKGTGLGLSTCFGIIKSHGGFINYYSEVGKGSAFKVYLPADTTVVEPKNPAVESARLPCGQDELVLVVDDEVPILALAEATLQQFGYRVLTAVNGEEAVSIYKKRQHEIAVILTDMMMPVMDGPAAIIALKAINPKVRIIGMSGFDSQGGMTTAKNAGVDHFIPKPYATEVLLHALHKVLHQKAVTH
jgi:two-component system cell cycle sensor histidine kinase/response regulator CckA